MMRARLGIDKTKSWADWAEEEEEAAEPTKTLADAKTAIMAPDCRAVVRRSREMRMHVLAFRVVVAAEFRYG